jgi:hypothetical protein
MAGIIVQQENVLYTAASRILKEIQRKKERENRKIEALSAAAVGMGNIDFLPFYLFALLL